jgi:hypothetical protein
MLRKLVLCFLAGFALAVPAVAAPVPIGTEVVDHGAFVIRSGDRLLGVETFAIEGRSDSLVLNSNLYGTEPTEGGVQQLEKQMGLVANRSDFGLRQYQSNTSVGGNQLIRGVIMSDTSLNVFREDNGRGSGETLTAPPGRLFVLDARLFSLFDLICLSLHGKTFQSRPLVLLALGPRDTTLEATATHLGTETIRWGSRPVQARKLSVTDGTTTYWIWANPAGQMLRLVHRESGTHVEREPPSVKKRTASKPPG